MPQSHQLLSPDPLSYSSTYTHIYLHGSVSDVSVGWITSFLSGLFPVPLSQQLLKLFLRDLDTEVTGTKNAQ